MKYKKVNIKLAKETLCVLSESKKPEPIRIIENAIRWKKSDAEECLRCIKKKKIEIKELGKKLETQKVDIDNLEKALERIK